MKIYKHQIESFIVLVACLNITYFNNMIPKLSTILFLLRVILICYVVTNMFLVRQRASKTMISICCLTGWIVLVSAFVQGTVVLPLRTFSIPLLLSLYVDWRRNSDKLYDCLVTWLKCLSLLIGLDFISMLLYPNGMYADALYSLNWVLGYKTARLVFSLPCCVLATVVSVNKYSKITWKAYICYVVSVYTLYHSQATAASVSLLFACIGMVLLNGKRTYTFLEKLMNLKLVIPVYAIVTFLVVYVQNSPAVQYVITQVLKKDATLTTRTYIWNHCISLLRKYPLTGAGYLSTQQYQRITNNMFATSAHNMSLTILVSGGIVGAVLYIWIVINAWNGAKRNLTRSRKAICVGILAILLVGLTSSSVVFSFCGFIFFSMLEACGEKTLRE